MEKLISGQIAKINPTYDDPIELTIVESDELCDVLDKIIKPKKFDEKLIATYKKEAST